MKINYLLSIIFIVVFSLSCNNTQSKPDVFPNTDTIKTDKQITLHPGQETIIELPDRPNTEGYNWYYAVNRNWIISIIEQIETPEANDSMNKSKIGKKGEGPNRFTIKGLKEGDVFVRFFQKRDPAKKEMNGQEIFYRVHVVGQKP